MERELNFAGTKPLLYLIATPIGNLQELSPRAIDILKQTDYIAAEDTRNSGQLMAHFQIDKPFISCHEHNEEEASEKIVGLLLSGKKIAYMSDAGYPGISDPGERLVKKCLANGIKVSVVSGPNAGLDALVCSGLPTAHFYFEGFLPSNPRQRDLEIAQLADRTETLVLYESPHRIAKTLQALAKAFPAREAVLARELTKAHEEFIRGTIDELAALSEETLRGEMVIVLAGRKVIEKDYSDEEIKSLLLKALKTLTSKEAIQEVSNQTKVAKKRVYSLYLSLKK